MKVTPCRTSGLLKIATLPLRPENFSMPGMGLIVAYIRIIYSLVLNHGHLPNPTAC